MSAKTVDFSDAVEALETFGGLPPGVLAELDAWVLDEISKLGGYLSGYADGRREALAMVRGKIIEIAGRR